MTTQTVTSNDTLVLNDNVFNDFTTGDTSAITFPNDLITVKLGKNDNALYALNAQGKVATGVFRLAVGSSDDQFLQAILTASQSDFPSTKLLAGTFAKRVGDGAGNITVINYALSGGVITRIPDVKENVEGDTSQAEVVYNLKFAKAIRTIQ